MSIDREAGNNPEDGTPYTSDPLLRPLAGPQPAAPVSELEPTPAFHG